jgi:predicted transcriptional regulator
MTLKNKEVLNLEIRNKIYKLVNKFAGSHLRELERKSGIPYTTLKYHLHFLTKHNLIIERASGGNTKYFPKSLDFKDIEVLGLLRQKNIRKILLLLTSSRSSKHKDIEDFLSLSPATVSWYLDGLIKKKIIIKEISGKKITYKIGLNKDRIKKVFITYKKSFFDSLVDKTIEMWE